MTTWLELHHQSELLVAEAEVAGRSGEADRARMLYGQAADAEESALDAIEPTKLRTAGITAVSAVSLRYKAGQYQLAEALAYRCLERRNLPAFATAQLNEILAVIGTQAPEASREQTRTQFDHGVDIVSAAGGEVDRGASDADVENGQTTLFRRAAAFLRSAAHRRSGLASKMLRVLGTKLGWHGVRRGWDSRRVELLAEVLDPTSLAVQITLLFDALWKQYKNEPIPSTYWWVFAVLLLFSIPHRWRLEHTLRQRLSAQDIAAKGIFAEDTRAEAVRHAAAQLGQCMSRGTMTAAEAHRIEAGLLNEIRFEVARLVGSRKILDFDVALAIAARDEPGALRCLNRAYSDRSALPEYPTEEGQLGEDQLRWQALWSDTITYRADLVGVEGWHSRSFLAIPIRFGNLALGVISIESTRPHHFDDRFSQIADVLGSHIALLGLVLVSRDRYNAWPTLAPDWG